MAIAGTTSGNPGRASRIGAWPRCLPSCNPRDAHRAAIEAFFGIPIDHLTAVQVLATAAASSIRSNSIVVAPDLGAVKLAREYACLLGVPMAFVHKTRLNGERVETHGVIGDVRNHAPLISVAPLVALAIRRVHHDESLTDLRIQV